jgi:hypothetical protein
MVQDGSREPRHIHSQSVSDAAEALAALSG